MPTCKELYKELNIKCQDIILESFSQDIENYQAKNHNFLIEFDEWISSISSRPEVNIFKNVQLEYQFGLLAVVQGQYRQAYMALRLCLEQTLAGIYFSANEFEFRLWMDDKSDVNWSKFINNDNGVFSQQFVNVFCPPLVDESNIYLKLAKNVYRECSEFVHGNFHTQAKLENSFEFNKTLFIDWHEKAETVAILIMFVFCVRYLLTINKSSNMERLEPGILEYLGHISSIRAFFDKERRK